MYWHYHGPDVIWEDGTRYVYEDIYVPSNQYVWCSLKCSSAATKNRTTTLTLRPFARSAQFLWRRNTLRRGDNCTWVTLASLITEKDEHGRTKTTASLYHELDKARIPPVPNIDGPAYWNDVLRIAGEFGTTQKLEFVDQYPTGVPAIDLPTLGVPPQTFFGTWVQPGNQCIGHFVKGYWAPDKPGRGYGGSDKWFRFTDFQTDQAGQDVTDWVMATGQTIKYAYWFVQ
ncbi:uncharacterized protein BDZ99DRAFT_469015 [Mytilinidion resinicola]|uniref:Uncharacterized protein n=1 Tax=Mytilinidion resinicola TaxID=574789 RepID=A0A6A6Y1Y6_9PEZI|nr:uncharacterized protein BDZ99DRAFT_469015 [Mytilinidion resinicola]KAF2802235.1 hypothetical protein BDZ99DRAFT_469015 [Mytilinidion resinicola]